MEATLQGLFRTGYESYKKRHGVSMDQHRAAQAIMDCQSEVLGYESWACPSGDYEEKQHHACRHRSCPRCHGAETHAWLEKTNARLLPCDHYHVVFTLPHELNPIWHFNRHWCADKLFKAASETRLIATIEEHTVIGGLGGAVAEVLAEEGAGTPLARFGLQDVFACMVGSHQDLKERFGLTAEAIVEEVHRRIA